MKIEDRMVRKILAGILIIISSILLGLSIAGIALVRTYKQPLTRVSTARLRSIDNELAQAQTALQIAEFELERTLRTVEAPEKSLETLKTDLAQAKTLFGDVNGSLESQLLPGLKASRGQIDLFSSTTARQTRLENMSSLETAANPVGFTLI